MDFDRLWDLEKFAFGTQIFWNEYYHTIVWLIYWNGRDEELEILQEQKEQRPVSGERRDTHIWPTLLFTFHTGGARATHASPR